jgi:mercuric ion transport protein
MITMPTVELVVDAGCPNVLQARAHLRQAFARAKIPPRWSEHRSGDPAAPAHARGYGSPTILVDGRDVGGMQPNDAPCCRVYLDDMQRLRGVPSVEIIVAALRRANENPPR